MLTPADPYMPLSNDEIVGRVNEQVMSLFPSAEGLELLWSSVVKIAQSLYREAPGMDPFRPDQRTPVPNFYLAGSYTKQVRPQLLLLVVHRDSQQAVMLLRTGFHRCRERYPTRAHLVLVWCRTAFSARRSSCYCWCVQDYIDSMEGATLSGRQAAARILEDGYQLSAISTLLDGKKSLSDLSAMAAPSFV